MTSELEPPVSTVGGNNPSSSVSRPLYSSITVAALVTEIIAIGLFFLGLVDLMAILTIHLGLGALLLVAILALERAGYATSILKSFAFLMLVAGPLGSAAALILEQLGKRNRPELLINWYDKIAPPTQSAVTLADRIIDDQLVRPKARLPKTIDKVITRGSMREKQALFASIVAEGHIEGVNLIEKALRSRDQRVRVQAAAVSAYIRSRVRASHRPLQPTPLPARARTADVEHNSPAA